MIDCQRNEGSICSGISDRFTADLVIEAERNMQFVPLYIDFDIISTANTAFNFYPHLSSGENYHLAVTDFSRVGSGATPVGQSYNIKIENRVPGLQATARVNFNAPDHPVQYITTWLGYNLLVHPLLNLRGVEIVNRDIVYVYLMQNISTGLYGPKIELNLARDADSTLFK